MYRGYIYKIPILTEVESLITVHRFRELYDNDYTCSCYRIDFARSIYTVILNIYHASLRGFHVFDLRIYYRGKKKVNLNKFYFFFYPSIHTYTLHKNVHAIIYLRQKYILFGLNK